VIDEIKKSIHSNLYQRTRSPLYGTLIISWIIWNWKSIYYLLTVDSTIPFEQRIKYIENNLSSKLTLILYPIISTIIVLVIFEFIANYAFWLQAYYKTWRNNKKIETEGKQLLTLEQSLKLRNDISKIEVEFEKLIQEKENEIEQLKKHISAINNISNGENIAKKNKSELIKAKLNEEGKLIEFKGICSKILNQEPMRPTPFIQELVTLGLISKGTPGYSGSYEYVLTNLGRQIHDSLLFDN
jgi:hypothetical protein